MLNSVVQDLSVESCHGRPYDRTLYPSSFDQRFDTYFRTLDQDRLVLMHRDDSVHVTHGIDKLSQKNFDLMIP